MRIAQVVSSYHPRIGGVEMHVRRIAQGCAEAGDDVTVLTHQVDDSQVDEWIGAVRVRRFPLTVRSRNYPLSLSLFRYLGSHTADFDLVHVHSYHTLVGHAAVGRGLPFVFTPHYHGTGHTPLRAVLHRLYRPAGARQFRAADAIICVSDAERDLVIKDFPGVAEKVVMIPSGTDPKLLEPVEDKAAPDEPVVITVGRLERYKNVDFIIDAFRALPSSAILFIVGDGPDRSRLEQHVRASGPGWPINFTGRISDSMLDLLFAQATVVTSASDHEAFGSALAEGLVSGARVVASAIPAHIALARLAGTDAPVDLVDPRDAKQFTGLLVAALRRGRVPAADLKLPSWADVVADTRELYARARSPGRLADRRVPLYAATPCPSVCCGTSAHGVSLTAAPYQRQLNRTSHRESPVHHSRAVHYPRAAHHPRAARDYVLAVAFAACEFAGMAAVVLAYNIAQTTLSNTSEFAWFWVGMFLLELPLAGAIARQATQRTMRTALLIFYGLVSYAPKLLRNPTAPIYHDEFAHWHATYEILSTGKLFQPNALIHIIAQYPGLHAVTAALIHATGLTIWQAATLLLVLFHVSLVLGVAALAEALGFNNRTASLIAILYALNSSFLYFDTQYAYESMAITLVVWTLATYVRAIRSQSREGRAGWGVLTVMLSAGTVITHHLSTFTLVLIMALVSLALSLPWLARGEGWVQTAVTAWSLTLFTALMAGAWFRFVAPDTWSYLSPYLGSGLSQVMQEINGSSSVKQLFVASLSPWWEQRCAYLVTLFALGLAVGGLFLIRARTRNGGLPRGRRRAVLFAFVLLGLVYFPSTIFILSTAGSEGARRSWAFTWIGLSMLVGPAVVWLLDRAGRSTHRWGRFGVRSSLVAVLAIALVGGTAAGPDASYRFPGPFLYGSDARSITPELLGASEWFSARFGTGNNIITDRYTGLIFASFGLQNTDSPSAGNPVYDLYLAKPGAPIEPAYLLPDLGLANYTYLIIDAHIAYDVPELGVYFSSSDPASVRPQGGKSPFYGRLNKFDTVHWAVKVFQSNNYAIYRLSLPVTQIVYQHQPPRSRGKVLQGKLMVTP